MKHQIFSRRRWLKLLYALVLLASLAKAQEPIGMITDNYLPSSAALFNPASVFTSPNNIDINVFSVDLMAYNNLAYVDQLSLFSMSGKNLSNKTISYNSPNTIRAFSRATLQGPSVIFQQNSISFGVITQVRSAESLVTHEVPSNLDFNNILDDSLYQFPASKAAGLNWMSIGGHLGKIFNGSGSVNFSMGANLNYLIGWDGISAVTNQTLDFIKNSQDESMSFSNVVMNYGYTSGFGNDVQQNLTSLSLKGSGVGTDMGIMISGGKNPVHYKWKAGLSVMDVGFISFVASKNVQRYQLITDTAVTVTKQQFSSLTSADAFTQLAAEAVAGKGSLDFVDGPLVVWLPAAISFQAEATVEDRFFINAMVVQRMLISQQQVLRPNSLTVTPRYETKKWAAGLPVNWYDYHRLQIGGFVRYGSVVLGTNSLNALFVPDTWEGADIYLGVHILLSKVQNSVHYKSGRVYCPKF